MGLTWQVFIGSCGILFITFLFSAPLLLVGYLISRAHARLKRRLLGLRPTTAESDAANAPQTETPNKTQKKPIDSPLFVKTWTLDDRDWEESWDRERRRRYGRHEHKHGRHHRRQSGGAATTTPAG